MLRKKGEIFPKDKKKGCTGKDYYNNEDCPEGDKKW